jgi:hypothetical protein
VTEPRDTRRLNRTVSCAELDSGSAEVGCTAPQMADEVLQAETRGNSGTTHNAWMQADQHTLAALRCLARETGRHKGQPERRSIESEEHSVAGARVEIAAEQEEDCRMGLSSVLAGWGMGRS